MVKYKKFLSLGLELIGGSAICYALYLYFSLAACMLSAGVMAVIVGIAVENSK
mgnify:FL=1